MFSTIIEGPFSTNPAGTYPNMFDVSGNEIGNFMPALPFSLTGAGLPSYWGTVELKVFSMDHCHVIGANTVPNIYNPNLVFFDITLTNRYKVDVQTYLGGTTDLVSTLKLSIVY